MNCFSKFVHFLILLLGTFPLSSCNILGQKIEIQSFPVKEFPFALELQPVPLEEAMPYFNAPLIQEQIEGIESITQDGWQSIHVVSVAGNSPEQLQVGPSIVIKPGKPLMGFILFFNTHQYDRNLGMLTVLDGEQVMIKTSQGMEKRPSLFLERNKWQAFRFFMDPLPEGLHTLIMTAIVEPGLNFYVSERKVKLTTYETDVLGHRDSPIEFKKLLWVTSDSPQSVEDWPPSVRTPAPDQVVSVLSARLVGYKPRFGESQWLYYYDEVRPGDLLTYYLTLGGQTSTEIPGEQRLPMDILVFWDDQLTQRTRLQIPVQAVVDKTYLSYPIEVPKDLPPGKHTLTAIGYPYPGYLHSWLGDRSWNPPVYFNSYVLAHFPILVK